MQKSDKDLDIDLTQETHTIITNSYLVGKKCFTFITYLTFGALRFKFYNKLVQFIESPSVKGNAGNHFVD